VEYQPVHLGDAAATTVSASQDHECTASLILALARSPGEAPSILANPTEQAPVFIGDTIAATVG
jgi:hypothetical protein